jgi:hypothetical protein
MMDRKPFPQSKQFCELLLAELRRIRPEKPNAKAICYTRNPLRVYTVLRELGATDEEMACIHAEPYENFAPPAKPPSIPFVDDLMSKDVVRSEKRAHDVKDGADHHD